MVSLTFLFQEKTHTMLTVTKLSAKLSVKVNRSSLSKLPQITVLAKKNSKLKVIYAPVEFYINAPSSNVAWQPQTAGSQANELYHLPEELFIVIIIHKIKIPGVYFLIIAIILVI